MPPKRAATSASTTRPAKKSANKVPQGLTEASEVLPQAEFVKLVKKHVLPGLDDEAFKEVFQQAVVKFKRKNAVDQKIKLDDHKKSLKQHAKELKSSLRHDWHDGSDDQMQIKNYMTGGVLAWLNDLVEVAIEGGTQLATTQKCLVFIESQMIDSMLDNCRADFTCCYESDYTVSDSSGNRRYQGPPDTVIPCFWRDLLLMALIQNDTAVITSFKAHSSSLGGGTYLCDVLGYIRSPKLGVDRRRYGDGTQQQ
ncbi:hypothetical protein WJX82_010024 [Trebouxia sp. C0006]